MHTDWKKTYAIPLIQSIADVLTSSMTDLPSVRAMINHDLIEAIRLVADSIEDDILPITGHESHRCTTYLALYGGRDDLPNLSTLAIDALVGVEQAIPLTNPVAGRRRWIE